MKRNREGYRPFIDYLHEGIWVIDKDAHTIFVNSRMAEMLVYTVDEMIGKPLSSFMDEGGAEIFARSLQRSKLGMKEQCDFEFLRKDGTRVNMLLELSPITDDDGNYTGLIAGALDITERKRVEEALQESERKYRELADLLPQIVFEIDEQGNFTFANHRAFQATGYTSEDINKGLHALEMVIPRDRDRLAENMRRALSGEESGGNEYTVLRKDGTTFPVIIYSAPITRGDKTVGLRGAVVDITERKQMEEALRQSAEKHRNLVDNSSDIISTADKSGNWTFLNSSVTRILGYEPAEMVGRSAFDFMLPEDVKSTRQAHVSVVREGRDYWEYQNRWLSKDGRIVTLAWNVVALRDERGNIIGAQGVGRDITEHRRMEEALRVSHRFLEIANRHTDMSSLLKEFVAALKSFTGCAAVGLRILDEEGNIPYQAYEGFSREFYNSESPLCIKSDQCMCINVIKGEACPKLSFYTEAGSFYMNGTTRFLAAVSEEEKGQTRNVCNQFGYESVALIPIRMADRILGLIHIADPRENVVPLWIVETLEGIAMQLGTAIQRLQAEEALRKSIGKNKEA